MFIWRDGGTLRTFAGRMPPWARRPAKRLLRVADRILNRLGPAGGGTYGRWVELFDTLSDADRDRIREHIRSLDYRPLISVVMPVYETPERILVEAINSVRDQLYPHWELCIADDASRTPHTVAVLRSFCANEPRIKWMQRERNGNISAASNSALALASGEFIALMDHDDLLPQHALYEIAVALNANPNRDIIYSDADQIDGSGRRFNPYFKTDWNPDLLLAHNMISHLAVYRRALVARIGGFREGFEGSQDYDLALRCADATSSDRICHIPSVLYHWRREYGAASFSESKLARCADAGRRAVSDHLQRRGEAGIVAPHPLLPNWNRVTRPVPDPAPLVSFIIRACNQPDLLRTSVHDLLDRTDYPEVEVLILDDGTGLETCKLFEELRLDPRVRIIAHAGRFNYSAGVNVAVAEARGSIIGLVSSGMTVINADWLSEMVSLAVLENTGAVGAKLLGPDNRVKQAGVILGVGGGVGDFSTKARRSAIGYFGRNLLPSSVSAVTADCLIVRKSVFREAGGFNEFDLPMTFGDIDFCLKIGKKGYRNVWTPFAELYHREAACDHSENSLDASSRFERGVRYMLETWGTELKHDAFYNDNFSTESEQCFKLAFPPRRQKPWMPPY
jgi:GT2 family glycosyltransferase